MSGHVFFLPAIVVYGVTCDFKKPKDKFVIYAKNSFIGIYINNNEHTISDVCIELLAI